MKPAVSVIIPNYNHAAYLPQRIDSVLKQGFTDFEIILLDDCSTDNSRDIIERYRGQEKIAHIVYNNQNSGNTFRQWRKGISLATADIIWIAESDDYCDENLLEKLVTLFYSHPGLALAYCKSVRVDHQNKYLDDLAFWYQDLNPGRWSASYNNNGRQEIKHYLSVKNTIPNASAVLFLRSKALAVIDSITDYRLSGDWLFWIGILGSAGDIAYTTEACNYFRTHTGTVRSSEESKNTAVTEQASILDYLVQKRIIHPLYRWAVAFRQGYHRRQGIQPVIERFKSKLANGFILLNSRNII